MDRNEQLTRDVRHTAKETEATLSRVEQVLLETSNTANDITGELHHQGEALGKIDGTLDEVDAEAQYGKKIAKQVNKGFLGWMFSSEPKKPKAPTPQTAPEPRQQAAQANRAPAAAGSSQPAPRAELNYKELEETGNKELAAEMRGHDDKYNSQLDNISALLDGLNVQAQDIGAEIAIQNTLLERLGDKSDKTHANVGAVNHQLRQYGK